MSEDRDSLPEFAPSEVAADPVVELSDEVFGELDKRVRGRNEGGGAVIWRRDMQRWLPIHSSLGLRPSRPVGHDYVAGAASASDTDDGLMDDEKIGTDWISAADMSSDDQDYEMRFPVLQTLLSEKRVDVKKPGPHFDRPVSSFASASILLAHRLDPYLLIGSAFLLTFSPSPIRRRTNPRSSCRTRVSPDQDF